MEEASKARTVDMSKRGAYLHGSKNIHHIRADLFGTSGVNARSGEGGAKAESIFFGRTATRSINFLSAGIWAGRPPPRSRLLTMVVVAPPPSARARLDALEVGMKHSSCLTCSVLDKSTHDD